VDLIRGPAVRGALALTLVTGGIPAAAQETFPTGPGPYDPDVPTVASVRGFASGASFSTYREIERALAAIERASDRVHLETYGTSVEGRPLRIVWISSPENLARLDAIRAANVSLATGTTDPTADLADRPLLAWFSFGVHGDEASGPETALELVYHLAASRDEATVARLDDLVVAIDPVLNPDGHERYVGWFRSVVGPDPNPDPAAREHRPPWAPGRTSHWLFDLNRDWAWSVMPETRARLKAYRATLPHVHVDFHEMSPESTYFFFPAASPVHAFYPSSTTTWARVFGAANAAEFDGRGWPYYTEEEFDLFYPGYGDSWPSFLGATGMTYEQAGGAGAGVVLDRPGEQRLTLEDRIERHFVAALTTLETAVDRKDERLADFAAFWRSGDREPPGAPTAWLVPPRGGDARALAELLVRQGIVVDTLSTSLSTADLTPFAGTDRSDSLPSGTYVVMADQPLGRYAAALLIPVTEFPDTSRFYDITGWSLPFLHDVPAWRSETPVPVPRGRWTGRPTGGPHPPDEIEETGVAIVWSYAASDDVVAAARLVGRGVAVRVAERPFRASGRSFGRGTFIVPLGEDTDVVAVWNEVVAGGGEPIVVETHRTESGIDLGSDHVRPLIVPRIAVASGPGTRPTSVGAAWWLLAEQAGLSVDVVRLGDLAVRPGGNPDSLEGADREPLDLDPYTVIVLPDASGPEAVGAALGRAGAERIGAWVRAGGTLVAVRSAAEWLVGQSGEGATFDFALVPEPVPTVEERRSLQAEREAEEARTRIPGTLVAVDVDTTSVLGYGFGDRSAAVLIRNPAPLALADRGNAYLYADAPPLAGYLPSESRERLAGTPYAIAGDVGLGHAVLFADDPGFRGILRGLRKAYVNAVLLVPGS